MQSIHRNPYLRHVVLLSVISVSHSFVIVYYIKHIYSSVSIQPQHVINFVIASSYLVFNISCLEYYNYFCACSVMYYFSFTLSYMFCTFQVLTRMCNTSSYDLGLGSQYPDHG